MKNFRKSHILLIAGCIAALMLAACGGSSSSTSTSSTNGVTGTAQKGPFYTGSTVTATQMNDNGTLTVNTKTTTVTNDLGDYSLSGISWGGLTQVSITGYYLDETTGAKSTSTSTMTAIIDLPAITTGTNVVNSSSCNPNIVSTIAASVAKTQLAAVAQTAAASGSASTQSVASVLQSANSTTLAALGLPTTTSAGAVIDPAQLNMFNTGATDANLASANQKLFVTSAALINTVTSSGGSIAAVASSKYSASDPISALVASLGTDIADGNALGTNIATNTAGAGTGTQVTTSTIQSGYTTTNTNISTYTSNFANVVNAAKAGTVASTFATVVAAAATSIASAPPTVIQGFALTSNLFNLNSSPFTLANGTTTTVATQTTVTALTASNVAASFTLANYTNATGTGPGTTAQTIKATFNFYIASTTTGDPRKLTGSIYPVDINTTASSSVVTVTVPTSATMTFTGVTKSGVAISGTATNVSANSIFTTSTAGATTFSATNLVNAIQNKTGQTTAALGLISTAGPYSCEFGFSGVNVGIQNTGGTGIASLFKLGQHVGGRAFNLTLTTQ